MLNSGLAKIYGIPTFRLNEAVKRNRNRFPEDFVFRLTKDEHDALISQIAMSNKGRGGRNPMHFAPCSLPFERFTLRQGAGIFDQDGGG
ncbi:MAG: ORF6N domain-containing protein [Nitrososphaerota archaeon]|nr:ORF6N domain-containing protein [Nitrososphaerota archaeon]